LLGTADNELLTQTDPGTPMGTYFRRYWLPALLSSELPTPDGPPVRVELLGERLVAFRETSGKVGLLEARCPHRHASLFWGRNEECGLRCVYHGWKFAIDGECLDQPAESENSRFKARVRAVAYDVHEAAGIVWAYMGPKDKRPPFPRFEFSLLPNEYSMATKRLQECNYLQNLEGELDSAHAEILHRVFSTPGESVLPPPDLARPTFEIELTAFGMLVVALRKMQGLNYWRMTPFLMPVYTVIPSEIGATKIFTAAVPRNDTQMWGYTISWNPSRPLDEKDVFAVTVGSISHVNVEDGSFRPVANASNDYLIDRELQARSSFTGIPGIRYQDLAVQEDQDGPLLQRDQENLGATDMAIVAVRNLLLEGARKLEKGIEPVHAFNSDEYSVRSVVAKDVPVGVPWSEIWSRGQPEKEVQLATGNQ